MFQNQKEKEAKIKPRECENLVLHQEMQIAYQQFSGSNRDKDA